MATSAVSPSASALEETDEMALSRPAGVAARCPEGLGGSALGGSVHSGKRRGLWLCWHGRHTPSRENTDPGLPGIPALQESSDTCIFM